MNKIFKVIWNHATQSWTVVSELSKAHKKQSSVKQVAKLSVLAASLVTASGAMAATAADNLIQINSTGAATVKTKSTDAIAIGNGAEVVVQGDGVPTDTGVESIAVGKDAKAYGEGSVIIGSGAHSERADMTLSNGNGAVAIGHRTFAKARSVATGRDASAGVVNSVAIGERATVNTGAYGIDQTSIAIGSDTVADYGSTIIGPQAQGLRGGNAVVGNHALAAKPASAVVGTRARAISDFGSVLGFGAISDSSYSTSVGARSRSIGNSAVAVGYQAFANGNGTVAIGQSTSSSGSLSIAIGNSARNADTKMGGNSLAVGPSSFTTADSTLAIGNAAQGYSRQSVAVGRNATVLGQDAIAIGTNTNAGLTAAEQTTFKEKADAVKKADAAYHTALSRYETAYSGIVTGIGGSLAKPQLLAAAEAAGITVVGDNYLTLDQVAGLTSTNPNVTNLINLAKATQTAKTNLATANTDYEKLRRTHWVKQNNAIALGNKSTAQGLNTLAVGFKNTVTNEGSAAVGNNNTVSAKNVVVLGNSVTVANVDNGATRDNAVVLGNASNGAPTVKAVNSAKVGHLVYNGFKGNLGGTDTLGTPSDAADTLQGRFVSVGAEGTERQIKHVAAGEISSVSTDAINGSQLYAVAEKIAEVPVVYTDAEGNKVTKVGDNWYPSSDIGDAVIINGKYYPAGTTAATANDDNEIKPVENVIASMHNPQNHGKDTAGKPVELRNISEGTKTLAFDKDGNPLVEIDGKFYKLNDDGTADTTTEITPATPEELKALADKNVGNFAAAVSGLADLEHSDPTSAMTVADAKKLGWVVSTNQDYSEAVSHLDEVRFNNGNGITITGETTGEDKSTRDITIAVKAADDTLTVDANGVKVNTGSINPAEESGNNKGQVTVADKDKNKVATVENVANAINSAKWFAKANNLEETMTDRTEKGAKSEAIGAGDEITFEADKNLAVKRNGKTFTYGLAKDIEVNSVTAKNKVTLGEGDKAVQLSADTGALKVADKDGNATQITNVDAGANTMEFDKDGNQLVKVDGTYYVVDPETGLVKLDDSNNPVEGTPATEEELKALVAANPTLKSFVAYAKAASGLADLENSIETNALTVADAKNLGWVVSASGNDYAASVTNANEVRFNGVNGVKVEGKTDEETGVRNINIGLEAGDASADSTTGKAVVGKDGNADTTAGAGAKFATTGDVVNTINNSGWKTKATDGTDVTVNPGDAVNYVDGKGTKANVAVTKVEGKPDVVNVSYDLDVRDHLTPVDNTTKSVTKAPFDAETTGKEAATVNDVLNAGWNLQANDENVDAVTHADTVNFTSDDGSVVITPTTDGKTTKLNFAVDKASVANSVIASTKGNASANSTTGKAVVGKDGNADTTAGADAKFATTGDVVNTINNTGWKTKATDGTDVTVNPGDAVNYVDGKGTKANVAVTKVGDQDVVSVSYDVKSANTDTLTVDANGVKVNTGSLVNASTAEDDANRGKVTVNAGDENKVATVKNVADAINSAAWTVKVADSQEAIETSTANDKGASVSAGTTVTHTAGKNLKVKRDGNNVTYALANDVSVNTVTTETATVGKGDAATTISTSKAGDNVTEVKFGDNAGKPVRVTNVANGVKEGDAVNVRQLNDVKANINQNTQAIGKLNDKIDQVEKRGRKGTAIAGAIGMLPQPHISGKSMVGVATTNYRGEQAVAVGYSRLSDNGKHIIKLSGSSNVSGKKDAMVGAAYGFQW